jgi:L-aspartate oxidase
MPLISEALRGEGAVFVDQLGTRFMQGQDLAARDIVARAVAAKYQAGGKVFLDAREVCAEKFPGVFVRPAAHYHMGGIAVDWQCESSVSGLFACGEAASTGLHGANRLASNSLLEALVTGRDAAAAIAGREMIKTALTGPASAPVNDNTAHVVVRKICAEHLGIVRTEAGILRAIDQLEMLAARSDAALVARLIAHAALRRRESRGAHLRSDFPLLEVAFAEPSTSRITYPVPRIAA